MTSSSPRRGLPVVLVAAVLVAATAIASPAAAAGSADAVDDADPAVFIDDVDIAEGGAGRLIFRFQPALEQTSCFTTRYVDGTATNPSDYEPNPGRICLLAGTEDAVTGISIPDDGIEEPVEDFTVVLDDLEHLSVGDVSATWTIVDDPVVVTPGAIGGPELDGGSQVVCLPVRLDRPQATPVTVEWKTFSNTRPGIATPGDDYRAASGTLLFAPGETERCAEIEVYGDAEPEPFLLFGEWLPVFFQFPSQNAEVDHETFFGFGLVVIGDDDR